LDRGELLKNIIEKRSYLCVGLDTRADLLPEGLPRSTEGMLEFNRQIIEQTADLAIAYKINTAFYEQYGAEGWDLMEETLKMISEGIFTIADAKRGDIGNTSAMYARAFFERMNFDSITVSPYMGRDSLEPFLSFPSKWIIVLGLTSNSGSADLQTIQTANGGPVYEQSMKGVASWADPDRAMFVVGATKADYFGEIRKKFPEYFFLVPGVGAQGGDLKALSKSGMNKEVGLMVNSSRGILYASSKEDFALAARASAINLQKEMNLLLRDAGF
jgi:orotidine-5'-phosphate decarboxylase